MPRLTHTPRTEDAAPEDAHSCAGCLDRRQVLQRAGAVGLGAAVVGVLAACGSGSSGGGAGGGGQAKAGADGSLAQVSAVPVGGAVSAKDANGKPIIIAQPEAGTIVAMTAICTHMGCTVVPDGKQLKCPCHSSTYSLTGQNQSGPAPRPLAPVDVHVSNGEVLAGKA
ncbi:QcrA and Rieske domain-containing protein [Cellulomonas alba]|uniref:Cytochrome bc1 complex Rieske iron-sulfur subunit n=1 Tax=Cellulomonas alba TaxID=3053467 RepID=A0ABT7SFF3_9CELL|nr:Rieske (2Fe-2S) protein [Cellulomonas alba]MDM7854907.1 Rieske (2Fe-2S) protein [Cellulomonas alba]